jgi:hypothetical protein
MWPDPRWSPTAVGAADAAEAAFILRQDQHGALIGGWPRRDCCFNLRRKVFVTIQVG